MVVGLTT